MPVEPASGSRPRRSSRLRSLVVEVALVLAIVAGVQWWRAQSLASGIAPPLAGTTIDGASVDLGAPREGPVLIHFRAEWCAVCRLMEGAVASIARDHRVIAVELGSGGSEPAPPAAAEQGAHLAVLPDPTGDIAARWGVVGVPTSFIIDGVGRIRFATVGISTEPGLRVRLWMAR